MPASGAAPAAGVPASGAAPAGRPRATDLAAARAAVLARTDLPGPALRAALTSAYDRALSGLLGDPGAGLALVAVGGLGRREPGPASDLDLVLVHDGRPDVSAVADALWYPLWDTGVGLDHSVRTVQEAVAVASGDLKAALGLLDARHVAGDAALAERLVAATRQAWRRTAPRRLGDLRALAEERAASAGELAFLLEPDLREARGGLRDVQALGALAVAQLADPPAPPVRAAYRVLLDVRDALQRRAATARGARRGRDVLLLQEQDAVAAALGHADADDLLRDVAEAARTIAFAGDATWRRVLARPPRRRLLGRRGPVRRPLADDVVEQDGEVVLARGADPAGDPVLVLRVAQAAAQAGLPVAPPTLERLAAASPPLPEPWPRPALEAFVGLLAAGPGAVPVLEALDQVGVLPRLLPEWRRLRSRAQRNGWHRFTVDRHCVETAAAAAALTRRVARPDLLLLGALLHDLGKGLPGDHCETGADLVAGLAPRLGLPPADVDVLVALVRHHLLLPEVATRRDLADPATARGVADLVGSAAVLELLAALTEADSRATGPSMWSTWKAGLLADLVRRTARLLEGAAPPPPAPLAGWQEELLAGGGPALAARDDEVAVVAPDRSGLLSVAAGVLALHRLDVRSASATSRGSSAVAVFRVAPRFGELPDWAPVRDDLRAALEGSLPLAARLAAREQAYRSRSGRSPAPPVVTVLADASDSATVVEVRAADGLGVLHRIAGALESCGLDLRTAHVSTFGADVVDAFYVQGLVDPPRVVRAVTAALEQPRPAGPAGPSGQPGSPRSPAT